MLEKDKPALMKILGNTPEFKPSEVIIAEEVIDSYLNNPAYSGYYIIVAEEGPEITGFACYGPTPMTDNTWDLYWEAVSREKQGNGIGSSLIEKAETEIMNTGGRMILIETSSTPAYEKTRRFYLGNGYSEVARITDFYSPGDDKIIFRKILG